MPQAGDSNKQAGTLYLDLQQLQIDIGKANTLLQDIGKNVGPSISSQIEKAIKQGIQNGVKNTPIPQLTPGGGKGGASSPSSAYKETVAALREMQKYDAAILQINKQLITAQGEQRNKLEQSRAIYTKLAQQASERFGIEGQNVTKTEELVKLETQLLQNKAKNLQLSSQIAATQQRQVEQQHKQSIGGRFESAIQNIPTMMTASLVNSITTAVAQLPIRAIKQFWNDAWTYATTYYDKLNEIRVVTGQTATESEQVGQKLRSLAQEMSVSSTEMAEGAITFYRQGLGDDEVNERLIATTQYAKTAGLSFEQSANMITASVNTISEDARGVEMTAQRVADVFLYLGDNAATSGEEIGTAMSRSASLADAAGVSFEMLGAYIATVSERTRQDAGTIGTALNAIMSRLTSVKQKGFNEEDETKVNDVAKALSSINVQLTDGQGEWRRIEDIFMDVGKVWDTLDDKTQNYLATVMAGTRQQNVFRTLMADLSQIDEGTSRAFELYEGALNSAGTAAQKYATYQESVTAAHDKMIASLEKLYSLFDANVMKGLYQAGGGLAEGLYGLITGAEEKTYDYSNALSIVEGQVNSIKRLRDEYSQLAEKRESMTEGSAEYNKTSQEMSSIIEKQAGQFVPFNQKVQEVGGYFESSSEAIAAMNDLLQTTQERLYAIRTLDLGNTIDTQMKELADAYSGKKTAEQNASFNDLVYAAGISMSPNVRNKQDVEGFLNATGNRGAEQLRQRLYDALIRVGDFAGSGQQFYEGSLERMIQDMVNPGGGIEWDDEALTKWLNTDDFFSAINSILLNSVDEAQADIDKVKEKLLNSFVSFGLNKGQADDMSTEMQDALKGAIETALSGISEEDWAGDSVALKHLGLSIAQQTAEAFLANKDQLDKALQDVLTFRDSKDFDVNNKDDQVQLSNLIQTYSDLYETIFGQRPSGDFFLSLLSPVLESTKKEAEGASEAVESFYAKIEAGRKAEAYEAKKDAGFVSEMNALQKMAKAGEWNKILFAFDQVDDKMFEDMTKEYGNLNTILDEIKQGHYDNALVLIGQAMEQLGSKSQKGATEAEKAQKKIKESTKDAYKASQNDLAAAGGYDEERSSLISYLGTKRIDEITSSRYNGNVDLTNRKKVSGATMKAAGWEGFRDSDYASLYSHSFSGMLQNGQGVAIGVTPILPDGTPLSPEAFQEYVNQLLSMGSMDEIKAFDADTEHGGKNLLLNIFGFGDESEIDAAGQEMGNMMEVLHQLQAARDLAMEGGLTETDIDTGMFGELTRLSEEGMLDGIFGQIEGLEEAFGLYQTDQVAGLQAIQEALLGDVSAWELYKAAAEASAQTTTTEEQQRQAAAIQATADSYDDLVSKFDNKLTPAQQKWAATNIKGLKQVLAGTKEYDDSMKDIIKDSAKLDADHLADLGKVWKNTSKIIESASKGGDEFNDVYAKSTKEAQKLSQAWGALNAIQSGSLTETSDIADAYKTLASATGLDADSLQNDLSPALWMLQADTAAAAGTIEFLANSLINTGRIDINNPNWQADLANLGAQADDTEGRVAALIQSLLKASGARLRLDGDTVKVDWGSGSYTPPSSGGGRRGGGGGGRNKDSDSSKAKEKTVSEIEKLTHMMDQIQELFEFHQSMIQQIQSIYSGKGELTNLVQVYEEERQAIIKNNKVLEENVKKLDAQIPGQQAMVAAMSTSDEEYEAASKDLDLLQKAHQKYSKQLLENVEALDKLEKQIEDTYEEIRQKRITVENMILEAIEDREELESRMLQGRIDMEEEVMNVVQSRYEKERDLIIENANLQRDALEKESSLLDENLAKRKERNELDKKQQELLKMEQQLIRISADPTRKSEADKLRTKIADLREEMAWDTAQSEVDAQKESIDQQIQSLDDYIEYVERYYEDLFNHPKQLIAEVEAILAKSNEEIIQWLKDNNEEYQNSSAAVQQDMLQTWETTLVDMRGEIETHWAEVAEIMAQGDDYIINFLMQNSAKYKEASATQAQSYVAEWKRNLEDLEDAYRNTYERIKAYSYVPIQVADGGSGGSSVSHNSSGPRVPTPKLNNFEVSYTTGGKKVTTYSGSNIADASKAYSALTNNYGNGRYFTANKKGFATGGIADFTGPAWLDGTPGKPERVLSAYQTELFEDLLASLHSIKTSVSLPSFNPPTMQSGFGNGFVMEGDVIINVDTLADDEDYEEVATHVMEEIATRMNFGSVIGGIRSH